MVRLAMRLTFVPKADGTYRTAEDVAAIMNSFERATPPDDGSPLVTGRGVAVRDPWLEGARRLSAFRNRILRLPARLADSIADATNEAKVQDLLSAEIESIVATLPPQSDDAAP